MHLDLLPLQEGDCCRPVSRHGALTGHASTLLSALGLTSVSVQVVLVLSLKAVLDKRGAGVCAEYAVHALQADVERRKDRALRDLDYDSHLGIERDPISREIISTASHT